MILKKELRTPEEYTHVICTNKMPYWVDNKEIMEKEKRITIEQDTMLFDMDAKGKKGTWVIRALHIVFGGGCSLGAIYTITGDNSNKEPLEVQIIGIAFFFFLFIIGAISLMKGIYYPDKKFLFDRIKGTVTMPNGYMNLKNKTVTVLFDNTTFYYNMIPKSNGMYRIQIEGPYTYGNSVIDNAISARWLLYYDINKENEREYASLFTWFMDKNRPLPPGVVFDPYRETDYRRRKLEGFPPPLYYSEVPTPEYFSETQKM